MEYAGQDSESNGFVILCVNPLRPKGTELQNSAR